MIVIPAVDVRGGRCVRLIRGDYAQETVFAEDPAQVAMGFLRRGATRIHIVDLDAARGVPDVLSRDAVRHTVRRLAEQSVDIEVGGGVRSVEAATSLIEVGATYVVMGSVAMRNPELAEEICRALPGKVLLGLDVYNGVARAEGWTEDAGSADEHLARWATWPAAGVIRTDIARDGVMTGPDEPGLRACIAAFGGPVIASGGIATIADLEICAHVGAAGTIVGRALYEGRLDLNEALQRFGAPGKARR